MSEPIYYSYRPDPGRTIYSGGKWLIPADQRPADWRERVKPKDAPPPEPKRKEWAVMFRERSQGVKRGPGYGTPPNGPPKPRKSRAKPQPPKPRAISAEMILELRANGMGMKQIAAREGCHQSVLYKRLNEARASADFRARDDAIHLCACGGPKLPAKEKCRICRRKKVRRAVIPSLRRCDITIERIIALWKQGLTDTQVAIELKCNIKLIARRTAEADPEQAAEIRALKVCVCGRQMFAWCGPICAWCKRHPNSPGRIAHGIGRAGAQSPQEPSEVAGAGKVAGEGREAHV